jgi:hypothetical protein
LIWVSGPYDIHIGAGLLAQADALIPVDLTKRSVFILADKNVAPPSENFARRSGKGRGSCPCAGDCRRRTIQVMEPTGKRGQLAAAKTGRTVIRF